MVIDLSTGNTIRIGNSIMLTVLAIEKDLIRFRVQSSEPDVDISGFLSEKSMESGINCSELN
jgi:hypothetical protein